MGAVFTARGIGYVSGSLVTGKILDLISVRWRHQLHPNLPHVLVLCAGTVIGVISLIIVPFTSNLYVLIADHVLMGIGAALIDVCTNTFLAFVWAERVNSFMQFSHCAFGLGSFVTPLIISLFGITSNMAYYLAAGATILSVFVALAVQLLPLEKPIQKKQEEELIQKQSTEDDTNEPTSAAADIPLQDTAESTSPTSPTADSSPITQEPIEQPQLEQPQPKSHTGFFAKLSKYALFSRSTQVSIIIGIGLFAYIGMEASYGGLVNTYVIEMKLAGEAHAQLVNSAYWLTFTLFRLLAAPISWFIEPRKVLILDLAGVAIGFVMALIFNNNLVVIWISTILLGISMASLFPTALAYPTSVMQVETTASMTSIMLIIGSVGEMSSPFIITKLFDVLGPVSLLWVNVVNCSITGTMIILMLVRFGKKEPSPIAPAVAVATEQLKDEAANATATVEAEQKL